MEHYSIILIILTILIGLSAMADKIKLPYPILLITAGITIGFVPFLPHIELEPEVIFLIFLPPLLYDAAFNISQSNFKANFDTISTLAISLVFITTTGIAVLVYYLIPGMTWPLAFVLGSILSATDAVSAVSITKGLGLSHKTLTILEGESLVNDASALVAYRLAVATVMGSTFVLWKATLQFLLLLAGGFFIGFTMGRILAFILKRLHDNSSITVSLLLLTPPLTYQIAEEFHVSGVIAVVILGMVMSRFVGSTFPESLKEQSKFTWDIIIFLLNGLIFILIGLQFPYVLKTIDAADLMLYTGYAFLITLVAVTLRTLRVFIQQANLWRAFRYRKGKITRHALLDIKTSIIISWSGMRGIVSLATAIALPMTLTNGEDFPERDAIIFISVVVVLFTIVGQGLTLPWLVKKLEVAKPLEKDSNH